MRKKGKGNLFNPVYSANKVKKCTIVTYKLDVAKFSPSFKSSFFLNLLPRGFSLKFFELLRNL